jgi:hypothetical protein
MVRPWIPSDLGSAVDVWVDTLDPTTYSLDNDGKALSWTSKVGSVKLLAGSGRPRLVTMNGKPTFLGGEQYSYFKAEVELGVLPHETSDTTILFVGKGRNSYNPTIRLNNGGSTTRGVGTVDQHKVGLPKGGNDLYTNVPYADAGNIVIGSWTTGSTADAEAWVDGVTVGERNVQNTAVQVNRLEVLMNADVGSDSRDYCAAVVILRRVLTVSERQQLEGWAAWSYDYVARLPANHPYKSAAPTMAGGVTPTPVLATCQVLFL